MVYIPGEGYYSDLDTYCGDIVSPPEYWGE